MADYLTAPERNKLLGMLADMATASYGPERTQQMQGLMKFLDMPAIATTLDRMSYGDALTTGKGMTTRLKPETETSLMAALSMMPSLKGVEAGAAAAGKAIAPAVERAVPKIMDRGGVAAQLMQDLAQGSTSKVIDHPFLKPSVAFSDNPFSGLSGPDKSNMTRYLSKLNNPGFAAREVMRENGVTQMAKTADTTPTFFTPEDMYRAGNPLVAVAGDTSRAGVRYSNINGVPLSDDLYMQGGFQYPIINTNKGKKSMWASLDAAAGPKQSHFDKVAKETGLTPRGVFFGMNPKDSPDFSTHVAEAVMQMIPALNPSKEAFAAANKIVWEKFPDFLGFDNPESMKQIMDKSSGNLRKRIAFAAKQKRVEELGFPSYDDIIQAINHPALQNSNVGDSGLSTFLSSPNSQLITNAGHNTYNRGIKGSDARSLEVSIPAQNMFPDIWDASSTLLNKNGQPLTDAERIGVVKMSHQYQMPDQKWLDQIMPVYEQELKRQRLAGGLLSQFQ